MVAGPISSGTIFVSWWEDETQQFRLLSYGPEHAAFNARTIQIAQAETIGHPECTPTFWMCASILHGMRERDLGLSCYNAAALAQYTGWRFFALQETSGGHCFIQEVPVESRTEFEVQIRQSLGLARSPLGLCTVT